MQLTGQGTGQTGSRRGALFVDQLSVSVAVFSVRQGRHGRQCANRQGPLRKKILARAMVVRADYLAQGTRAPEKPQVHVGAERLCVPANYFRCARYECQR